MGYFLLRLILYGILFYFIFKIIRAFVQLFSKPEEQRKETPIKNTTEKKHFGISSEDIIEAEFTEIKSEESKDDKN